MKTCSLAVCCLLGAAISASAQSLIPTAFGTTWEYQIADSLGAGAQPQSITVVIHGTETIGEKTLLKFETSADKELKKTELIAVDERGVLCYRRAWYGGKTDSFDPPEILIPAGLKIGSTWELDDQVAGSDMHQKFTVTAQEDVSVPAGKFRAFRLHCEQPWPISVTIDRWFAPGTGIVKDITVTRGPTGRLLSRVVTVLRKLSVVAMPAPTPTVLPTPVLAPSAEIHAVVSEKLDGPPQTEFPANAPNIFVRWNGENLLADSIVRIAWVVEDVGDLVPPNFIVDEKKAAVTTPRVTGQLTLSRPKDGWAPGKYRLEVYLDNDLKEKIEVAIKDEPKK